MSYSLNHLFSQTKELEPFAACTACSVFSNIYFSYSRGQPCFEQATASLQGVLMVATYELCYYRCSFWKVGESVRGMRVATRWDHTSRPASSSLRYTPPCGRNRQLRFGAGRLAEKTSTLKAESMDQLGKKGKETRDHTRQPSSPPSSRRGQLRPCLRSQHHNRGSMPSTSTTGLAS